MWGGECVARAETPPAKRSACCGAGRGFLTLDRKPAVVLGYYGGPPEYWGASVQRRAFI